MSRDLGNATASAITGIRAAVDFVNTTVNGLGERAGNAALEVVVMAMKYVCNNPLAIDTSAFVELSRVIGQASQRPVPEWKAVVSEKVFSHESGLHADGVLKNPKNYEGFDPAEVGLQRHMVLGKHSGGHGLKSRLSQLGVALSGNQISKLLDEVHAMYQENKRSFADSELLELACHDFPALQIVHG